MKEKIFLIGVDGGGTKTIAVLADWKGKILRKIKIGPSNPNKIGFEKSISNLKKLLKKISKNYSKEIKIAYLGIAGGLERDIKKREKIRKALQKIFSFKIYIEGDQKIAFRAATNEKEGVILISGTGSIAMGWKGNKEEICGGWDWLIGDQGSAFWVGRKFLEKIAQSLDGREKWKLKEYFLKELSFKNEIGLYRKFYQENFVEKVALISKIVDKFSKRGEKNSKRILIEGAKEVAKMAKVVIKKLNFQKEKFPLVLVGGMFKSKIYLKEVKKEIKKIAPFVKILKLNKPPVLGAIKLAREKLLTK